jgi:hypothetical protein
MPRWALTRVRVRLAVAPSQQRKRNESAAKRVRSRGGVML